MHCGSYSSTVGVEFSFDSLALVLYQSLQWVLLDLLTRFALEVPRPGLQAVPQQISPKTFFTCKSAYSHVYPRFDTAPPAGRAGHSSGFEVVPESANNGTPHAIEFTECKKGTSRESERWSVRSALFRSRTNKRFVLPLRRSFVKQQRARTRQLPKEKK